MRLLTKTRPKSRRTPGRPAASAKHDARELLLSAATELFASQGVAATTFAMIASRAGLTPAMLHYYFKDRDQLLDAVVDERLLRVVSKVWDPVQPGQSRQKRFAASLRACSTASRRCPGFLPPGCARC